MNFDLYLAALYAWACGLCNADDMNLSEYREHMACTHNRPLRGKAHPLAIRCER
jgi:hypothetical protein